MQLILIVDLLLEAPSPNSDLTNFFCVMVSTFYNYFFFSILVLTMGFALNLDILRKPHKSLHDITDLTRKSFWLGQALSLLIISAFLIEFFVFGDNDQENQPNELCVFRPSRVYQFSQTILGSFTLCFFLFYICDTARRMRSANRKEKDEAHSAKLLYPNSAINQTQKRFLRAFCFYWVIFFFGVFPFIFAATVNFFTALFGMDPFLNATHLTFEKIVLLSLIAHPILLTLARFHIFGMRVLLRNFFKKLSYKAERSTLEPKDNSGEKPVSLTDHPSFLFSDAINKLSFSNEIGEKRITTVNYFSSPSLIGKGDFNKEEIESEREKFLEDIKKTMVTQMSRARLHYFSKVVWNAIKKTMTVRLEPFEEGLEGTWRFPLSCYLDYALLEIDSEIVERIESRCDKIVIPIENFDDIIGTPKKKEMRRLSSIEEPQERIAFAYCIQPFRDLSVLYKTELKSNEAKAPLAKKEEGNNLKGYPSLGDNLSNCFGPRNTNYNIKIISKHVKKYLIEKFLRDYHKYMRSKGENTYLERLCGLFSIQTSHSCFSSFLLALNPDLGNCSMMLIVTFNGVIKVCKKSQDEPYQFKKITSPKEISDLQLPSVSRQKFERILLSDLDFLSSAFLSFYSVFLGVYKRNVFSGLSIDKNPSVLKTVSRKYLMKPLVINYFSNHVSSYFNPDSWKHSDFNSNENMTVSDPELYKSNILQQFIEFFY